MAARIVLTEAKVRALKPPTDGKSRRLVMDAHVPGLLVCVTAKGGKSFMLRAKYPGRDFLVRRELGKVGQMTIDDSRLKALRWLKLLEQGIDPQAHDDHEREQALLAAQRRQENSFTTVAEAFIADKLATERRGREVEKDIRREFIPAWGVRPITEITTHDVLAVVRAAKQRGAFYQAHTLLGQARRLFNWAIDQHCYGLEDRRASGSSPRPSLVPSVRASATSPMPSCAHSGKRPARWRTRGAHYFGCYLLPASVRAKRATPAGASSTLKPHCGRSLLPASRAALSTWYR